MFKIFGKKQTEEEEVVSEDMQEGPVQVKKESKRRLRRNKHKGTVNPKKLHLYPKA